MQNDALQETLASVKEELRLQREHSAGRHKSFTTQNARMEESAVAAERRADAAEKRALELDKQIVELTAALTAMMEDSVIKNLQSQIVKAKKERDDTKASDKQNRVERYGSTSHRLKKLTIPIPSGNR